MASSISEFVLFSGRWHVRVLALLHRQRGARFVVMKQALGVSADSLSRCLKELMALGLVQRNPGYGHPLRPEYLLTETGQRVAVQCAEFEESVQRLDAAAVIYRKWSVPTLVAVDRGVTRFNDLKSIVGITPRALTQALSRLGNAQLICTAGGYSATTRGSRLAARAPLLNQFAI